MKKFLILFVATFSILSAHAQYKDSAAIVWLKLIKADFVEVDGFTDGVTNDSIRGVVISGKYFQAKDLKSTVFSTTRLRIAADGSNQITQLKKVLSIPYITGIELDAQNGGTIVATGSTIDFYGKRIISRGGTILKADSIANISVYAPADVQLFDSTTKVGNLVSGTNMVSPKWWGAKGDGTTDDLKYFQKAADVAADSKISFLAPLGTYFMDGSLTLKTNGSLVSARGAKINAGQKFTILLADGAKNVKIEDNDIEMFATSGTEGNIIALGDTSGTQVRDILIKGNKIKAHRIGGTAIVIRNAYNVRVLDNEIDSTDNKGIEFRSVINGEIIGNTTTNNGRSGIAIHSYTNNVKILHNTIKGTAQNLNFFDGGIDVYATGNYNIWIEDNYIETGDSSLDGNLNHSLLRVQGLQDGHINNNTFVSTSPYLLYPIRFSSRDSVFTKNIQASGNIIHLKAGSHYNRIVSIQDVENLSFTDYHLIIDSIGVTSEAAPVMFYVSGGSYLDSVKNLNFRNGDIKANGNPIRLLGYATPIKNIDFSSTDVDGMSIQWYTNTATQDIENVRWIGGDIRTNQTLAISNNIKSIQVIGLNYKRTDGVNTMWSLQSGYTGTAIIKNNILNGNFAVDYPYNSSSSYEKFEANYTVGDSVDFVFPNRSSSTNNVTLPPLSDAKSLRKTIGMKNVGSSTATIIGVFSGDKNTLATGEVGYWGAYDTAWRYVGDEGLSEVGVQALIDATAAEIDSTVMKNVGDGYNMYLLKGDTATFKSLKAGSDLVSFDSTTNPQEIIVNINADAGAYSPTLSTPLNLASSTVGNIVYQRLGNNVQMDGSVTVTPTAGSSTPTGFQLPLLFSPNFTASTDIRGTFTAEGGISLTTKINANTTDDRAVFLWTSANTDEVVVTFHFSYTIIQP